ncbi:hypothetical protein FB567DRAFT_544981 [Paraphoma chrysanthemicola]|uniref:Uncharacterized protein n=1 Tax=Paraphoma chrysanthemicola TaxID=798071 RepID=A0A8K0W3T0_9PLEO|nr:hypothetical protein FB567DRAFT_544981 [Paraphoma chrysanthemicola]
MLTRDELVQRHQQAVAQLERKLRHIPPRVFPSGTKPTISDIYAHPKGIVIADIHPFLQLITIFRMYNDFAAAGFRARKKEQDINVTMGIFYWQMDENHSLTHAHSRIRWNILLALIALETPGARAQMDKVLEDFLNGFVMSWQETVLRVPHALQRYRQYWTARIWKPSKFDFVRWNKGQGKRMRAAMQALESIIPPQTFPASDFWERAAQLGEEEFKKYGNAWAVQYLLYVGQEARQAALEGRRDAAEALLTGDSLMEGFGDLGMDDTAPAYLSEEHFETPMVKALMVEITADEVRPTHEETEQWMDPSKAISLLEGTEHGIGSVADVFKSVPFVK